MLKRIAVLGIGAHTLPSSRALLNYLAKHYAITVYAEVVIEPDALKLKHDYVIKPTVTRTWPRRIRDLLVFLKLLRYFWREPFHLIHVHSNYPSGFIAVMLQKILGVPALVNLEGGEAIGLATIGYGDLLSERRAKLNKWIINEAKAVTALTFFQRDLIYKNLDVVRPIHVLTRGVDQHLFKRRTKMTLGSPLVFLSVTYLSPIKDPEVLLRTFHHLHQKVNCVLIHVGQDYMNGAIQKLAEELGISQSVSFEGHVPYDKIPMYYAQSDVLLLTSQDESQGVVVAEAMASGVLVCGTHVGLIADLSGSCCLSRAVGDYHGLADAILLLLKDEVAMNQLRSNAYEWSANNSLERTSAEFIKIYEQLRR